jgi:hypothetical protein
MSDKVHDGTPQGSKSLCVNCRNAHLIHGLNFEQHIFCRATQPGFRVTFPVEKCSVFDDKRVPSLYQMETIAWSIQSRNRGPMGFASDSKIEIVISPPERPPNAPQAVPSVTGKEKE